MSFLDRFKRKPPASEALEAKSPAPENKETTLKFGPGTVMPTRTPGSKPPSSNPGDIPALGQKIIPGPVSSKSPATPAAAPTPPAESHEMVLELGDFLHRIPQNFLQPGPHDVHQTLRFAVDDMAERISKGTTTIHLSEIYKQLPSIFRTEVPASEEAEIRFPWQKVMMLLNQSRGARPGAALSEAAATALADRLKSKRATRNIIPTKPAPPSTPGVSTPPIPPDTSSAAPEKRIPPPAAAPAASPAAAPQRPAPVQAELKLAKSTATQPVAPAPQPDPPAAVPQAPAPENLRSDPLGSDIEMPVASSPEDDDRLTREELLRARDHANRSLLRVKGEYERALSAARDERRAIQDERDRFAADLEKARKEIQDKLEQVRFEKSVASRSSENIQKLAKERDALRAERDSLAKQAVSAGGTDTAAAAGAAILADKAQTRIDDLQQKIAATEAAHRAAEEKLAAELEARQRLEQQLTAAAQEKIEIARQLETAGVTLRAELLEEAKKREADGAAAIERLRSELEGARAKHQELQSALEKNSAASTEATRSLEQRLREENARELESALASLRSDFEAAALKREQEITASLGQLQEQLKSAQSQQAAAAAELEKANSAKEQAIRSLEQQLQQQGAREIEAARAAMRQEFETATARREAEFAETIQQLRGELNAAREKHSQLSAELTSALTAGSSSAADLEKRLRSEAEEQLKNATATLRAEFEAAAAKRDQDASTTLLTLRSELSAANEGRAKFENLLRLAQVAAEKQQAKDSEAVAELRAQLTEAKARHDELVSEVDRAHAAARDQLQSGEERFQTESSRLLDSTTASLRAELEAAARNRETELAAEISRLQSALTAAEGRHLSLASELESAHASKSETLRATEQRLEQEASRLIEAQATALKADFEAANAKREAENARIVAALQQQLAASQAERDNLAAKFEQFRAASESTTENLRRENAAALAAIRSEFEAAKNAGEVEAAEALKKLQAELNATLSDRNNLQAEIAKLSQGASTSIEQLKLEHTAMLGGLRAEFQAKEAQLQADAARTIQALQNQLDTANQAHAKLGGDFEQLRTIHSSVVAASEAAAANRESWESRAIQQLESDIENYRNRIKDLLAERETARGKTEAAAAEFHGEIEKISLERDEIQKARAEIERQLAIAQQHAAERDSQNKALEAAAAARAGEHEIAVRALISEKDAAIATIASQRDTILLAKAEVEKRLAESLRVSAERETQIQGLNAEIAAHLTKIREREDHAAGLVAQHKSAFDEQISRHQQTLSQLETDKEAAIAAIAAERDSIHQARAQLGKRLLESEKTIGELLGKVQRLETDLLDAQTTVHTRENEISRLNAEHAEKLASQSHVHERAIATLIVEKDAAFRNLTAEHGALDKRRTEIEAELASVQNTATARQTQIEQLEKALAETKTSLEQTIAIVQQKDSELARLAAENQQTLAAQAERHERSVKALEAEREAAVSAIAAEKAAQLREHHDELATLGARHQQDLASAAEARARALNGLRAELNHIISGLQTEHETMRAAKLSADDRVAGLISERDESRRETAAVAQRLAIISIETDKKIADLERSLNDLQGAKQSAITALDEAREAHKAQSAVFAREFKAVVKQRDETQAEMAALRTQTEEMQAELRRERSELQKLEADLVARHEREITKLRRERDAAAQQRDVLRDRMARLMDEQRDVLDTIDSETRFEKRASKSAPTSQEPPAAAASFHTTESTSASTGEQTPPPPPPPRSTRTRDPKKQPNIIEITEAEILSSPEVEAEPGIRIQRVRPIIIPPPNVRVL